MCVCVCVCVCAFAYCHEVGSEARPPQACYEALLLDNVGPEALERAPPQAIRSADRLCRLPADAQHIQRVEEAHHCWHVRVWAEEGEWELIRERLRECVL